MLCGGFREGAGRRVTLEDVDGRRFDEVLDMWCGKEGRGNKGLVDVMTMAGVADRLQMVEVAAALEDAIIAEMGVRTCAEVLVGSRRLGLRQVEEAAWEMAVGRRCRGRRVS